MATHTSETQDAIECSLCIVGAGLAGLTVLFVAAQYLGSDDTVVLIDRRPRAGGMWNDTYNYIRLHQPYEFFTAGNIDWKLNEPREYLATGSEVRAHLDRCLEVLRSRINIVELFEHELDYYEETQKNRRAKVHVGCHPRQDRYRPVEVAAERLVMAIGFDVPNPRRLELTSDKVVSTTPQCLEADIGTAAPVYIVGGGKTAMDTVYTLINRFPRRRISVFAGDGTVFLNRNKLFPTGHQRWWSGKTMLQMLSDVALRFDGSNEDDLYGYFRETYALCPGGTAGRFMFGILSEEESKVISEGTHEITNQYLMDVCSGVEGPEIIFRDGTRRTVAAGSIFVNCTGHLLREGRPYEPYLSKHGRVLSINARSSTNFSIAIGAYLLAHLYFMGILKDIPLYELDLHALNKKSNKALYASQMTQSILNLIIISEHLSAKTMRDCGANLDSWFPLVRRMGPILKLRMDRKRYVQQCRDALDRIESRFDVPCGPLVFDT